MDFKQLILPIVLLFCLGSFASNYVFKPAKGETFVQQDTVKRAQKGKKSQKQEMFKKPGNRSHRDMDTTGPNHGRNRDREMGDHTKQNPNRMGNDTVRP